MFMSKQAIGAAALLASLTLGLSPLRAAEGAKAPNPSGQSDKTMTDTAVPSGAIVIDKTPTGSVKRDCRTDSKLAKRNDADRLPGSMDKRDTCD
jgi:hypothetical protein